MSNALVKSGGDLVRADTGEVVEVTFSMPDYLASVSTIAAIQAQQKLAAAYDTACASLIGPNDEQKEGSRTFKKKSAWRKLARHFNISTSVVGVTREDMSGVFVAIVTVRATGPWGQSAEAVGACGQDEATGRRVITVADAIATAETRATNRAISNLIAMGEVSAEEMSGKGEGEQRRPPTNTATQPTNGEPTRTSNTTSYTTDDRPPEQKRMPFGKTKGTPLGELSDESLQSAAEWCKEKGKFLDLAEACYAVIANRAGEEMRAEAKASRTKGNVMDPQDYDESEHVDHSDELPF